MVSIHDIVNKKTAIAVVGMGYVGLPLAVAFGKKVKVLGFDIHPGRIEMLKKNQDPSSELNEEELKATTVDYTSDAKRLSEAAFFIIAVPTPIDGASNPDLGAVRAACRIVGQHLAKGSVVVLESTVYPGVTEEVVGPEIEGVSGLKAGRDFSLGYSPERINPGDREHTLAKIVKVVSGQDPETLDLVAKVYELVVEAGVHRASTLKVAEAAKVIENIQRDLNIALMNELSIIFNQMGVDTHEVIEAAGTKWNFIKYFPGLVGGHCIGVDPYYLTHKAKELGYNAEIILAGRRLNDSMGKYVAEKTVKCLIRKSPPVSEYRVLVLGMTFKENVADIRNTKVVDIIKELRVYGVEVYVQDLHASHEEVKEEYGVTLSEAENTPKVHAVVVASPHKGYCALSPEDIKNLHEFPDKAILVDVKRALSKKKFSAAGVQYFGL